MKYITEKYNSLIEFKKSLNRELIGFKSLVFEPKWVGCNSEQHANDLMLNGDQKSVKLIQTEQKKRYKETKITIYKSPVGFTPCMGAYMAGDPNNMFNIRNAEYRSSKVINYFYALDVDWHISYESIAEVSAKILNVVASLENMGYRVNLYVCSVSNPVIKSDKGRKTDCNTLMSLFVKIKDSGKQLNISRLAFPLSHPAFFRWFVINWEFRVVKNIINTNVLTFDHFGNEKIKESIKKNFRGEFHFDSYYSAQNKSESEILNEILKKVRIG